jgi:cell shape-determining protein MreD
MPSASRQVLAVLACVIGLQAIVGQLNHVLSPFALTIHVAGLLVAFAGLRLDFRRALIVALVGGLWFDASAACEFGRHAFLFALAVCMLARMRARLPREEVLVGVVSALFINLAFFVVAGFLDLGALPDPAAGGLRLLADLLVSQLFVALTGPWFFACQSHALKLAGASPAQVVSRYV